MELVLLDSIIDTLNDLHSIEGSVGVVSPFSGDVTIAQLWQGEEVIIKVIALGVQLKVGGCRPTTTKVEEEGRPHRLLHVLRATHDAQLPTLKTS